MAAATSSNDFGLACAIARQHGMFAVAKPALRGDGSDYILYRKTDARPVRLGRRSDPADFRRFVERCAGAR